MSDFKKARLLRNMALKEQAKAPPYIQRQHALRAEISQLEALLTRMQQLQAEDSASVRGAHHLQSDRWYALRLIEEAEVMQNKLEFLRTELSKITHAISVMSHRQKHVTQKAEETHRAAVRNRADRLESARVIRHRAPPT